MKTVVIGSGVAGLAVACRLASRGVKVDLFEKNSTPGGKISEIRNKGYRFDTGPSLFTLPSMVTDIAGLDYFELENSCRYFFPDGTEFNFYNDQQRLKEECESTGIREFGNIAARLQESRELYDLTANLFLFNSFHKLSNFVKEENRKIPLKLHKLKFLSTMHSANKKRFGDKRIVQLFDRYATYNGSSPYRAPAILNMISHLEHNLGAFFPAGGIYSIVKTLYNKAIELGVEFRFNSLVSSVEFDKTGRMATGIQVNGEYLAYDMLICDCDVKHFSDNMMPPGIRHPLAKRLQKTEPSSSALIFYWGIKGEFPLFDVHNIFFTNDYKKEFEHLFDKGELYHDPTIYLFISKKVVNSDAPEGCENWFVMVNAPANTGQEWSKVVSSARGAILKKINTLLLSKGITADIGQLIETEHIASPFTIEKNTLSSRGSLYGSSSNSMMSAFLRHPNHLRKFRNIWFTGGSVHPGGGIPLCLASAMIADKEIEEREKKKTPK